MPRLNKILGFLAVGFVLAFLGKISKVDLYKAYFKTIAEYEIRNTQGLQGAQEIVQLTVAKSQSSGQHFSSNSSGTLTAQWALPGFQTETIAQIGSSDSPLMGEVLNPACPIRGPNLG